MAAVHAACGDVGRSGGLSLCAGCVCGLCACRANPKGAGVLERQLRTEEGGGIHGSMRLCMGGCGFNGRAADSSLSRVVLLLRASASAMPPLGPSSFSLSLRTRQKEA